MLKYFIEILFSAPRQLPNIKSLISTRILVPVLVASLVVTATATIVLSLTAILGTGSSSSNTLAEIAVPQLQQTAESATAPARTTKVTSIPQSNIVTVQMHNMSSSESYNIGSIWIPSRSMGVRVYSDLVDTRQFQSLSVLLGVQGIGKIDSSNADRAYVQSIPLALIVDQVAVTFVDPDTGASSTIIKKLSDGGGEGLEFPVGGPYAFVTLVAMPHLGNSTAFQDIVTEVYLRS